MGRMHVINAQALDIIKAGNDCEVERTRAANHVEAEEKLAQGIDDIGQRGQILADSVDHALLQAFLELEHHGMFDHVSSPIAFNASRLVLSEC